MCYTFRKEEYLSSQTDEEILCYKIVRRGTSLSFVYREEIKPEWQEAKHPEFGFHAFQLKTSSEEFRRILQEILPDSELVPVLLRKVVAKQDKRQGEMKYTLVMARQQRLYET